MRRNTGHRAPRAFGLSRAGGLKRTREPCKPGNARNPAASKGRQTGKPLPPAEREVMSHRPASDVAFTPSVKAEQQKRGARATYARMERGEGWPTTITDDLRAFLAERDSLYFATASAEGQPYVQHRGGPPASCASSTRRRSPSPTTPAIANTSAWETWPRTTAPFSSSWTMPERRRIKIWGRARAVEGDAPLLAKLMPEGYAARGERVILFTVEAWDMNCPQHIPQKIDARDARAAIERLQARIEELEAANRRPR